MSLPLMPGTNELVHGDLLRTNYRKCHTLASKGLPRVSNLKRDTFVMKESATSGGSGLLPANLAMDRKVLRFRAYFREAVNESAAETDRSRQCIIYFFLEDNTLAVVEPRQLNSGMNQGTLIKRHKIPLDGEGRYVLFALNVYLDLFTLTTRNTDPLITQTYVWGMIFHCMEKHFVFMIAINSRECFVKRMPMMSVRVNHHQRYVLMCFHIEVIILVL